MGLDDYHEIEVDLMELDEGEPHYALFLATAYLGLKDLLSVEWVCRSLRDWVRTDNPLWRNIRIDEPLSWRVTDDVLVKLTDRAEGLLRCLSLVTCRNVTAAGLSRVLEKNPGMTKLCVPGCVGIGIAGVLSSLRASKLIGTLGIKQLRVGELICTQEQFEELKFLINADNKWKLHKTYFRHVHGDDDRAIDIETCPKCQNIGFVYDCPAKSCERENLCRACEKCIQRCIKCGCCKYLEHDESTSIDLCIGCSMQLLNCRDSPAETDTLMSVHSKRKLFTSFECSSRKLGRKRKKSVQANKDLKTFKDDEMSSMDF